MFFDLNIPWNKQSAPLLLHELRGLGYQGAAFTTSIDQLGQQTLKNLKDEQTVLAQHDDDVLKQRRLFGVQLKHVWKPYSLSYEPSHPSHALQLRRLHVNLRNATEAGLLATWLKNQQAAGPTGPQVFDFVSVQINDEKTWHQILNTGNVDLINIDLYSSRLPFTVRRGQLLLAARQHMYFEVCLAKALVNALACRNLFRNLPYITRYLPKDRLILTSGAVNPLQLRSPADMTSLMHVCGYTDPKIALATMSTNAQALIERAALRRVNGPGYSAEEAQSQFSEMRD